MQIELGQVVATPGALEALEAVGVHTGVLLNRHMRGDWGDICADDRRLNDQAAQQGERLLSAYRLPSGTKVWIVTEWDRSSTTLLLPDEY